MNKSELFKELYNRFGAVRRARGCFLYTAKSHRVTDLYQEGGRAILGWEGGSAFTLMKNIIILCWIEKKDIKTKKTAIQQEWL